MYESPITVTDRMAMDVEKTLEGKIIAKAKAYVDIDINGEELKKALNYDRRQYVKGYEEGYKDGYQEAENKFIKLLQDSFINSIEKAIHKYFDDKPDYLKEEKEEEYDDE